MVNKISGIPIISYFGDFGDLVPFDIGQLAIDAIKIFRMTIGVYLKVAKTEWGKVLTFLGLEGSAPAPVTGMDFAINLPISKRTNLTDTIDHILELGVVTHSQIYSLLGRLSFSETSTFGRFGRPTMPLYVKLNAANYRPILSGREISVLQWWGNALANLRPLTVSAGTDRPDGIVFTDAATATGIIAAVEVIRSKFTTDETVRELRGSTTGPYWGAWFSTTNLIYRSEMLALLAILYLPNDLIRNKNATLHIDNGNAFGALVNNNAKPTVIVDMSQMVLRRIYELGIAPWFGRVQGARNIADPPIKCTECFQFHDIRALHDVMQKETVALGADRSIISLMTLGGK